MLFNVIRTHIVALYVGLLEELDGDAVVTTLTEMPSILTNTVRQKLPH